MDGDNRSQHAAPAGVNGRSSSEAESDESVKDDGSAGTVEMEELDQFLKHAEVENGEHLSDQTPGGLYDCSLSTPTDKSLSRFSRTVNDGSESNPRNINDLSCSMLECGHTSDMSRSKLEETFNRFSKELKKKNELIKMLCTTLDDASNKEEARASKAKTLLSQVSYVKDNFEDLTNLSLWSKSDKDKTMSECSEEEPKSENFRLSTYIRKYVSRSQLPDPNSRDQSQCDEELDLPSLNQVPELEHRSAQTSPVPCSTNVESDAPPPMDKQLIETLCLSFLNTAKSLKDELSTVRQLIKQPYENHRDFPIQQIAKGLEEITKCHTTEVSSLKDQLADEVKHRHEVQNALKDEIKTLKMRFQDKIKQRDNEITDLRARLLEVKDNDDANVQIEEIVNTGNSENNRPPLDDSFTSNSEEETFSNLTRTKVEYLKLTPSEYVEDEIIDTVHIPDAYRQVLEDANLKLFDMEKKLDANRRYLEEQTHDREVERDEFQQALESLQNQMEELKKENGKLYEVNKQNIYQIEEYDTRLKNAEEDEMDMIQRHEKTENELKAAVEKIFELREIIRDLEKQTDLLSTSAIQLKEHNQVLLDELDKQEILNRKEQPVYNEQDTYSTLPMDVTDEIQSQLYDLAKKIESKINEMDNVPLHTRPNSSCSGMNSAISTEDISCRELAGRSSRNFDNFPIEDIGSLLLNGIRRLECQFESLIRFEDVIMKKLKDSELRCSGQKAKLEEVESQVFIYQDKCSSQVLKIADLEGKVDALRFESSNQNVISSLKSRLGSAAKQLEEYKILLASKEQELSQLKLELNTLKIQQVQMEVDKKEACSQTYPVFDDNTSFANFTYEGVSPEKIRRMDTINPLSTSVVSMSGKVVKEGHGMTFEPHPSDMLYRGGLCTSADSERYDEPGGSGDGSYDKGNSTIKEMDENLLELQKLLQEKDKMIKSLQGELQKGGGGDLGKAKRSEPKVKTAPVSARGSVKGGDLAKEQRSEQKVKDKSESLLDQFKRSQKQFETTTTTTSNTQDEPTGTREETVTTEYEVETTEYRYKKNRSSKKGKKAGEAGEEDLEDTVAEDLEEEEALEDNASKGECEEEDVTIDVDLNRDLFQSPASLGSDGVYEATYSSEYEVVDGSLIKYIGTKLLYDGVRKDTSLNQGRVQETDLQIEIATLNTQIQQLKRALEEERKRSANLTSQLKFCEEEKAGRRSSSPSAKGPVQRVFSSQSVSELQSQQRELVHQVEEGRTLLNMKQKEIIALMDQITNLETKFNAKLEYEQELLTRLNSTSASLRRCEDHGRDLAAKNIDGIKEIRRLRDQLDKLHASRSVDSFHPQNSGNGNEYFEQFMRAKSHKKALAWQKKYLTSVVVGYKSILRQVGHGNEHPELLQIHIPLAPSAVGLLDKRSEKTHFRIGALAVLAIIRMKYMVNRWHKKRPTDGSPDSEYNMSRHPARIDPNILRPTKGILKVHPSTTLQYPATSSAPVVNNNVIIRQDSNRGNVDDISEYLTRFESLENEISSSLSRNLFPS